MEVKRHYRVTITGGRYTETFDTWACSDKKAVSNIKFRLRKQGVNVDFTSRYTYKTAVIGG